MELLPNMLHGAFLVFQFNYTILVHINLNLAKPPHGSVELHSQYFKEYLVLISSGREL